MKKGFLQRRRRPGAGSSDDTLSSSPAPARAYAPALTSGQSQNTNSGDGDPLGPSDGLNFSPPGNPSRASGSSSGGGTTPSLVEQEMSPVGNSAGTQTKSTAPDTEGKLHNHNQGGDSSNFLQYGPERSDVDTNRLTTSQSYKDEIGLTTRGSKLDATETRQHEPRARARTSSGSTTPARGPRPAPAPVPRSEVGSGAGARAGAGDRDGDGDGDGARTGAEWRAETGTGARASSDSAGSPEDTTQPKTIGHVFNRIMRNTHNLTASISRTSTPTLETPGRLDQGLATEAGQEQGATELNCPEALSSTQEGAASGSCRTSDPTRKAFFSRMQQQMRQSPKRAARDLDANTEATFTCAICLQIFEDPVVTECKHNFCLECLRLHFRHALQNPRQVQAAQGQARQAHPSTQGDVQGQNVNPPPDQQGTAQSGTVISCPLCRAEVDGQNIRKADGLTAMMQRILTSCTNEGCRASYPLSESKRHQRECEHVITECPLAKMGCEWRSMKRLMNDHLAVCPYYAIRKYFPKVATQYEHIHKLAHSLETVVTRQETTIRNHQNVLNSLQHFQALQISDHFALLRLIFWNPQLLFPSQNRWMAFPFHLLASVLFLVPVIAVGLAQSSGQRIARRASMHFHFPEEGNLNSLVQGILNYSSSSCTRPEECIALSDIAIGDCDNGETSMVCFHLPVEVLLLPVLALCVVFVLEGFHNVRRHHFFAIHIQANHIQAVPTNATPTPAQRQGAQPSQAGLGAPQAEEGSNGATHVPPAQQQQQQQTQQLRFQGVARAVPATRIAPATPEELEKVWLYKVRGFAVGKIAVFLSVWSIVANAFAWSHLLLFLAFLNPIMLDGAVMPSKFITPVCGGALVGFFTKWFEYKALVVLASALALGSYLSPRDASIGFRLGPLVVVAVVSIVCLEMALLFLAFENLAVPRIIKALRESILTSKPRHALRALFSISSIATLVLCWNAIALLLARTQARPLL